MIWHAWATYAIDGRAIPESGSYALADPHARHGVSFSDRLASADGLPLSAWSSFADELAALAERIAASPQHYPRINGQAKLCRPLSPSRIYAAASNFIEHAGEMGTVLAAKAQSAPFIFMKAATSVIGPEEPIVIPASARQVDWEVELAAVIGSGGRNIAVADALNHVSAYTIINDISARDLTRRSDYPFKFDWFRGKSFDTFGPLGPWLVPASVVGDPQRLAMRLSVNDEVKQDDSTAAMIFSVAEQIAYLSEIVSLQPGDVIATGTPKGVGMGTDTYLKHGDIVVASIDRIGTLRNPVIDAGATTAGSTDYETQLTG
ncbi:MAG: fumarylacetoacetate hydrolase family protein [Xanthobacteraceae bacterium]|nr:fumarylacetoacetate hydrolase family protein [Xanthobacteraceae bacterium]